MKENHFKIGFSYGILLLYKSFKRKRLNNVK